MLFSGFGLSTTSQFITSGGTIEGGTFHTAATAGAGTLFRSIGVDHVWVTAGVDALSLGGSVYHEIGIIFDAAPGTDPPPPGGLSLYTQNTEAKFRFLFVTTGS